MVLCRAPPLRIAHVWLSTPIALADLLSFALSKLQSKRLDHMMSSFKSDAPKANARECRTAEFLSVLQRSHHLDARFGSWLTKKHCALVPTMLLHQRCCCTLRLGRHSWCFLTIPSGSPSNSRRRCLPPALHVTHRRNEGLKIGRAHV